MYFFQKIDKKTKSKKGDRKKIIVFLFFLFSRKSLFFYNQEFEKLERLTARLSLSGNPC